MRTTVANEGACELVNDGFFGKILLVMLLGIEVDNENLVGYKVF